MTDPCNMDRDFQVAALIALLCVVGAGTIVTWAWRLTRWGIAA